VRWALTWEVVNCSSKSVVGYLPAGKDVVEDIVRIHYQETTAEDMEDFMRSAVTVMFWSV
jgi:hypothetical protein